MSLPPGTQLGPYELLGLIGAGGMGEVYKAMDPKLNRLVAIKVLPAGMARNPDALARFEREAHAVAALSHPNVPGIFDLGNQGGIAYAVMELLVGETLRERLKGGALAAKRAIEIATELAQGLGAAHERGIVHRDVKPENIFLTEDGRVKVLDFGLARLVQPATGEEETEVIAPGATVAGMVLGTTAYMSPEQVKGEPADHRADVFAFGVVLYEMLSGQRPFTGETSHHTLTAILDQDPPPLLGSRGPLSPALERLVAHCLEKKPKARFQSMVDVAYDLQNLEATTTAGLVSPGPGRRRRPLWLAGLAGAAGTLLAVCLARALHLPPFTPPALPAFTRVTYALGTIEGAFFGPDGRTVYYSERIQGGPPELFVLHPGSREPRAMGVKDALLLGLSPSGDLAILRHPETYYSVNFRGTLAQVGAEGGAVKESRARVTQATWDGRGFATLTDQEEVKEVLEFGGRSLGEFQPGIEELKFLRLSRDGRALALVLSANNRTEILSYDREGHRTVHFTKPEDIRGDTLTGLAWGPDGNLWFSELQGDQSVVWSLDMHGARRPLWRGEGRKALMDVSRDGRLLLADQQLRRGVQVQRADETAAQDISIANGTQALGFSADGGSLLLLESPVLGGGTAQDQTFLWSEEAGTSVRIAAGAGASLSPDGRWINFGPPVLEPAELDLATGGRRPVLTYHPGDASGLVNIRGIYTTPDARIFAMNINRMLSELYVVDGIR